MINVSFSQKRRRETVTKGCMRWFVWDSCTEHNSPLKAALCLWRHFHPTTTFPLYPRPTLGEEATDGEELEGQSPWKTSSDPAHCVQRHGWWTMSRIGTVTGGEADGMDVWIGFGGLRERINGRQQATSGFHRNYLLELSALLVEAGGGREIPEVRQWRHLGCVVCEVGL